MIRIPVDFNAMNEDGTHVFINTVFLPELAVVLKPGMRVILYEQDDIQVEAVTEFHKDENGREWWYGVADWSTLKDL